MSSELGAISSPNADLKSGKSQEILHFYLEPDTHILLPLFQLTEVLTVPLTQIIPIPLMPAWTMGGHNWRGEVLWVIDFGAFLGLTPWHRQSHARSNYQILVLNGSSPFEGEDKTTRRSGRLGGEQKLGLVVADVRDIEWCEIDTIHSPPTASLETSLAPFTKGILVSPSENIFVVLDGQAIISRLDSDFA